MNDNKKATAVMSAELHSIRTAQEAIAMSSTLPSIEQRVPLSVSAPVLAFKPWGMSGRQAQMQMRNLMQMRTFKRSF